MNILSDSIASALRKRHNLPDDAVVHIKTLPMEAEMMDDHTVRARITTDSLDEDGEALLPKGMDATRFEKTGAIFWNHDYDRPVAKHVKLTRSDHYVDAVAEFAKRPDDYEGDFFPDFARAMVNQQVVKGVSVGFIGIESRAPSKKDGEHWGDALRRVWSKYKLLEWSFAPIQCNPDAMVQQALAKGILTPVNAKAFFGYEGKAEAPEMAKCSVCEKEYAVDDMTTNDDGTKTCSMCAAKPGKRVVAEVVLSVPEQPSVRVVRAIAAAAPAEKCVRAHRVIQAIPKRKIPVRKLVVAEIKKRRGAIYSD